MPDDIKGLNPLFKLSTCAVCVYDNSRVRVFVVGFLIHTVCDQENKFRTPRAFHTHWDFYLFMMDIDLLYKVESVAELQGMPE